MIPFASAILIIYGLAQIHLRDLWWWDTQLLFQFFNMQVERTEAWDRQQIMLGSICSGAGVVLLMYYIGTLLG